MGASFQSPRWREEVTRVKKGFMAVLATVLLAMVFVSTPVAAAGDEEPLRAVATLSIDMNTCGPAPPNDCFWSGTVAGDINGNIEIREYWDLMFLPGNTEHFFEYFTISVDSNSWVSGVDQGVWNMGTQKFRANGQITDASDDLSYLIGYHLHEMGSTSGGPIVTGIAQITLTAP